jgi:hypothetical protein
VTGAGVVGEEQIGVKVAFVTRALHKVDARLLVLTENTFCRAGRVFLLPMDWCW